MYEKNLDRYRATSTLGLSPFEVMARIMESASLCMNNVARAIENNDVKKRSDESEKALMLLAGLMDYLNDETPEQKKMVETLKIYYRSMMDLVTNLNIRPEKELAETLSQSFSDFAEAWRNASHTMKAQKQDQPSFYAQG
ncbi:MAG: flagellar protein FliS [Candidatus Nucleicultricaceae bacterium]